MSPDTIQMCGIVKGVMNLRVCKKAWTYLHLERKKKGLLGKNLLRGIV